MKQSQYLKIFCGLFLTLLLSFQASAKQTETKSLGQKLELDSDWDLDTDDWGTDGGKTWYLKSDRSIYASEVTQKYAPPKNNEVPKVSLLIEQITSGRNTILNLLGIQDWHITDKTLSKSTEKTQLTILGSFHNSHSKLTNFKEVHIWSNGNYRSLSINFPSETKFGENEKTTKVIKRFISSVGGE